MTNTGKVLLAVLISLALSISGAYAEQENGLAPVSDEKQKLLEEFFDVAGFKYQISVQFKNAMRMIEANMRKNILLKLSANKSLTKEECEAKADELIKKIMDNFSSRFDYQKEVRKIHMATWGKHFSVDQVKDLIAFYKSAPARKFTAKVPELQASVLKELRRKLDPIVRKNLIRRMREIKKESDREVAGETG